MFRTRRDETILSSSRSRLGFIHGGLDLVSITRDHAWSRSRLDETRLVSALFAILQTQSERGILGLNKRVLDRATNNIVVC